MAEIQEELRVLAENKYQTLKREDRWNMVNV